jgi:trans-aconitate 2-methyltransferase
MTPLDWDAATYDRVADPQEQWARELIARLQLRGDERVLDAGCGSGRVTRLLAELVPDGAVIAVDGSAAMAARARENLPSEVDVQCQDLLELTLDAPVDLVFSNAVFHHIHDHDRLFGRIRGVLRPGGRLVAQCGGEGNIAAFRRHADAIARRSPYSEYLEGMPTPWLYESPPRTEQRLRATGFDPARCWLQPKHTLIADAPAFARSVLLNYYLERLPATLGEPFVDEVLGSSGEPLELDYVRLNIEATAA